MSRPRGQVWLVALVSLAVMAGSVQEVAAEVDPLPTTPPAALPTGDPGPLGSGGGVEPLAPVGDVLGDPSMADPLTDEERVADGGQPGDEDPPVREVVGERTASTESWRTAKGQRVTRSFAEPQYFQVGGEGLFVPIDNRLVPLEGSDGGLTNAGNAWSVEFGATAGDGVTLVVDGHRVSARPLDANGAARAEVVSEASQSPTSYGVSTDGNQVLYREVWPGVDVRYTVSNSAVKEELILKTAEATGRPEYRFALDGATVGGKATRDGWTRFVVDGMGEGGPTLEVPPLLVQDREGQFVADAKPEFVSSVAARGDGSSGAVLSVGVDPRWLAAQGGSLPVVIDPSYEVGFGSSSWASYSNTGYALGTAVPSYLGRFIDGATSHYWRSVVQYDLSSVRSAGGRVVSAKLDLTPQNLASPFEPSPVTMQIAAARPSGWSYAGAAPGWNWGFPNTPPQTLVTTGDAWDGSAIYGPYGIAGNSANRGRVWMSEFVDWFIAPNGANTNYVTLGLTQLGDVGLDTFRGSSVALWTWWDVPSNPGTNSKPANKATIVDTLTPTLEVTGRSDPEGATMTLFVVSQNPEPVKTDSRGICRVQPGGVVTYDWSAASTWTVPAGVLRDGSTYYWSTITQSQLSGFTKCSNISQFRIDKRLGVDPVTPMRSVGPVAVNLATGNLVANIDSQKVATVGGDLGVGFTYNSQAEATRGLRGVYYEDVNHNALPDDGPPEFQRVDPAIDFSWGTGAPSPLKPAMTDWFVVKWTGYVTAATAGTYVFGGVHDDSLKITVGGTSVYSQGCCKTAPTYGATSSTFAAGETKRIEVTYNEGTSSSTARVYAKVSGGADKKLHELFALTTEPPQPPGWRMSVGAGGFAVATVSERSVVVTLEDGSTIEFTRPNNTSTVFTAPVGSSDLLTRDPAGTYQLVTGDGTVYQFDSNGLVTSITTPLDDRNPAATQYVYSAPGGVPRLDELKDPVSGRSVRIRYGGGAHCTTPPAGFDPAPAGLVCAVDFVDFDGSKTDLFYKSGRLARWVNPGGVTTDFGYDGSGRLNSVRDPLAFDAVTAGIRAADATVTTNISYDGSGRVSTVQLPQPNSVATPPRQTETFTYASTAPIAGVAVSARVSVSGLSEPNGYTVREWFDDSYRSTRTDDAAGRSTTRFYDGATDAVAVTIAPDGMKTTTVYDASTKFNTAGKPIETWGPAPKDRWPNDAAVVPSAGYQTEVPHTTTVYDGGIGGLAATYWDNASFSGGSKLHGTGIGDPSGRVYNVSWGNTDPTDGTGSPWALQLDGWIDLTQTGNHTFTLAANGVTSISVDGHTLFDTLTGTDNDTQITRQGTHNVTAAGKHRISIRFANKNGAATLGLSVTPPVGGTYPPTGADLSPDYALVTSATGADGVETETFYADPELGLATKVVTDPGGLALTDGYTFEPQGAGSLLRKTSHTLPAGFNPDGTPRAVAGGGQAATVTYDHYAKAEVGPAIGSCPGTNVNQGGLPKTTTAADPDGSGPETAIVREVAYDVLGRAKASRVVGDDDWTCATYDTRGRVAAQTFPSMSNPADASLDTPARTVTNTYSVSGNPLLSHTTDTDATAAGRYPVQTLVDLLGRVVEYRDEWGYTTHNSFDQAGRLTGSVVRDPSVTVVETLGYTYNTSGDGVNQLATQTLDGVTVATLSYDPVGRPTVVTYGNGTTSTVGFDGYQRPSSVTHAKGATTITSDAVTRDTRTGRIIDQSTDGTDPNPAGVNYTYDNAGRLTSWRAVDPATGHRFEGTYRFDGYTTTPAGCEAAVGRNSNRLEETRTTRDAGGAVLESWTSTQCADNADRLTSYQPPSGQPNPFSDPVYDHHGNLVSSGNEIRGYDSADRHLVTNSIGGTSTTVTYRRDVGDRVIERSVDGTVVARYAHTANGDTPALTLTPAGAVAQVTVSLPGGVLLTKTSSSETWSHPNLHGDIVATTAATGTKQGDTHAYDPFGNPLSAADIPDNSQGAWDYGWHGQQQRPLEHQTGLTPIIEMGARQYAPVLGRFLEVDPVEGGTPNDYLYPTDPLSQNDLSGEVCWSCAWKVVKRAARSKSARRVRNAARRTYQTVRLARNTLNGSTAVGLLWGVVGGGKCSFARTELMFTCSGMTRWSVRGGTAVGNTFVTSGGRPKTPLLRHEAKHADQWFLLGWHMAGAYAAAHVAQGECNVFERLAGFQDGGYRKCR